MTAVQLGMPSMPPAYGVGNLYEESPFPAHARDELRDEQMRANIGHATHTIRAKRAGVVGEFRTGASCATPAPPSRRP